MSEHHNEHGGPDGPDWTGLHPEGHEPYEMDQPHAGPEHPDQPHLSTLPEEITAEHDPDEDAEEASPMWKIIGAVVLAVVIIAGIVIVILLATGRGGTPEPDIAEDPGTITQSMYTEPSTSVPGFTTRSAPPRVRTAPLEAEETPERPERTRTSEETSEETTERTSERTSERPATPSQERPPSARAVTDWAKTSTGLSEDEPFSAAPADTWMHAVTGVRTDGQVLTVRMNADRSIDVPAGQVAADYYSAVLAQGGPGSWESQVTEVIVLDRTGTAMVAVPVPR